MIEEPGKGAMEEGFREPLDGAARATFQRHPTAGSERDAAEQRSDAEGPGPTASSNENPFVPDAINAALAAPDPRSFLLALADALVRSVHAPANGESSVGTMLGRLGNALDEEFDEEEAFQDLVNAIEGRRFGARALHEAVPIIAALFARIVSAPISRTRPGTTPAEIAGLVRSAAQAAREALDKGGAQSWRALPEIAATIARRAARRNLSVVTLAEALPRLWARQGSGTGDESAAAPDRAPRTGEPRRMVLSGPVEIVILER